MFQLAVLYLPSASLGVMHGQTGSKLFVKLQTQNGSTMKTPPFQVRSLLLLASVQLAALTLLAMMNPVAQAQTPNSAVQSSVSQSSAAQGVQPRVTQAVDEQQ